MLVWYLDTIGPSVMNVICIVVPIIGFIVGFMKGFTDRSVKVIEGALIIVLSLFLKNPISSILYKYIPFLEFEYRILNVLLFEFLSFVILAIVLIIVIYFLNKFVNIVERFVGFILHIGVPSSIMGALVSLIEFAFFLYVFIFIVFFFSGITNSPIESSMADKFYNHMPIMRQLFGKGFDACIEVGNELGSNDSKDKINYKSMKTLMDNHFITVDNAKYIVEHKKISFAGSDDLLAKY